jgi:hypothetical protein
VLWLIALIPTIEWRALLRSLARPISVAPIALFALALAGTLWSDAAWGECLHAVGPTAKLLMLPLLLYHFERSPRGNWVFIGFLASCTLLLAVSLAVAFNPDLTLKPETVARGIFVKNYIDQSQEFALCAVALAYPIMMSLRANRLRLAALLAAIALGFVANMMFVVVSRTALATLPILMALFLRCSICNAEPLLWRCVVRPRWRRWSGTYLRPCAQRPRNLFPTTSTRRSRTSPRDSVRGWSSGRNRWISWPRPR